MDKPGSTDSSDISICVLVHLEDGGACIEIEGDRWITVESRKSPQLPCQVTGALLVNQIEIFKPTCLAQSRGTLIALGFEW